MLVSLRLYDEFNFDNQSEARQSYLKVLYREFQKTEGKVFRCRSPFAMLPM